MLDEGDRFGIWLEWDGKEAPTGPAFAFRLDGHGLLDVYLHQNGMGMLRDITPAEVFESDLFRRRTKSMPQTATRRSSRPSRARYSRVDAQLKEEVRIPDGRVTNFVGYLTVA